MIDIIYPDFKVIQENWWKWKLKDGTVIKSKVTVISFQLSEKDDSKDLLIGFQLKTIVGLEKINSGLKLKTKVPKTKLFTNINDKSVKKTQITDYHNLSSENNYYEIYPENDTTLLVIISLANVSIERVNKYTSSGDPVFWISTQHRISLISLKEGDEITSSFEQIDEVSDLN